MTPRFNLFFRWFARRFFRHFDLDDATVERLRELEQRGAVVYVMRYASRLDYFLFNTLFRREGLRLSGFANGIRFWYYRPLRDALRTLRAPAARRAAGRRARARARVLPRAHARGRLAVPVPAHREPALAAARAGRGAIEQGRQERDLLTEVVALGAESGRPVFLVPLALFWRKGPRARAPLPEPLYGALTRPNDVAKVLAFLTTYRGLHVKVGEPIDVRGVRGHARRTRARAELARVIRRSILTFLYREERVVEGPVLQPYHRVQEIVVRSPAVSAAVARVRAPSTRCPTSSRAWRRSRCSARSRRT